MSGPRPSCAKVILPFSPLSLFPSILPKGNRVRFSPDGLMESLCESHRRSRHDDRRPAMGRAEERWARPSLSVVPAPIDENEVGRGEEAAPAPAGALKKRLNSRVMMPHPPQMRRDFSASLIQISALSAVQQQTPNSTKNKRRKPRKKYGQACPAAVVRSEKGCAMR